MASGSAAAGLVLLLALHFGQGTAAGTEELVIGEVKGEVTLTCRNVSPQAVLVEWFHGDPGGIPILFSSDDRVPSDARLSLVKNSSLHISGLRLQDEGNYTCKEVLLNETVHRHRIQLLVARTGELVIGEVKGEVTLTCRNVSPQAVLVEWFHGDPGGIPILFSSDDRVPSDARLSLVKNSSLHISGLRLQDEGNYTCKEVLLNETVHRHRIQLLVASGPEKVNINIHPTTALPNGTLYAKKHDTLNFTCTSDSWPVPTIQWVFSPSSSGSEVFTEVNNSLNYFVLSPMFPSYQGNYSCSATNPRSSRRKTVTQELLIYYPPPSSPRCWAQTSTESSKSVQLFCSWPKGYPHPTLQWTNQGNLSWVISATGPADTSVATLNGSPLLHGKEFTCHGSHVIMEKANQVCSVQLEGPLIVSDGLRSCFVGRAVTMTCQLTACNPPAKISWLRNLSQPETEIRSGGRFLISQKGNISTLVIQNCSSDTDNGYYVCKAENPLGLRELYIYLTVTEPVNVAGIVGGIVVVLLLVILIFSGLLVYFGPHLCLKANILRNQDAGDILVLVDSEEGEVLMETTENSALQQAMALANGGRTRRHAKSSRAEVPDEIVLQETKGEARPST